jgi:hypothetical protein
MATCKTVRVQTKDGKGSMVINEDELDEKVHKLAREPRKPKTRAETPSEEKAEE